MQCVALAHTYTSLTPRLHPYLYPSISPDTSDFSGNARGCAISSLVDGRASLFVSTHGTAQSGIYEVTAPGASYGTALPSLPTATQSWVALPGFPIPAFNYGSHVNGFVFQDANTIWAADSTRGNTTATNPGGLHKYVFSSGLWRLAGMFVNMTSTDIKGFWCGTKYYLLITTTDFTLSVPDVGTRVLLFDTTALTYTTLMQVSVGGTPTSRVEFRGIAFVPGTVPSAALLAPLGLTCPTATPRPAPAASPVPLRNTSYIVLRTDGSAANSSTLRSGTMVLPTYYDEVDGASGAVLQTIAVPILTSALGAGVPVKTPMVPPPFVVDPNSEAPAQSVGFTQDDSEGQGATSTDGCYFTFMGYEAYAYTVGWLSRNNANGVNSQAATPQAMDAGSNYTRIFVTLDAAGHVDATQRSEAMTGGTCEAKRRMRKYGV